MTLKKPRITKYHRLKRFKFRADMKKENLYNLSRLKTQLTQDRTFFQQKWTAKSITRGYHAEHVREGQWVRMFSRRPPAVVPMNPQYLAAHDGSDEASGRGSGRERIPAWLEEEKIEEAIQLEEPAARERALEEGKSWDQKDRENWRKSRLKQTTQLIRARYGGVERGVQSIPYMQMVYYPLERRLDMAVYRALFASSARQARQFVCHGGVKVNGQTMRYSGYLLNPGDMFSVEPERAMWGVGQNSGKLGHLRKIREADMRLLENPPTTSPEVNSTQAVEESIADDDQEVDAEDPETVALLEDEPEDAAETSEQDEVKTRKRVLSSLIKRSRDLIEKGKAKKTMQNKLKKDFRALVKDVRASQSKIHSITDSTIDNLQARFETLNSSFDSPKKQEKREEATENEDNEKTLGEKVPQDRRTGSRWHPREWLSPFAFVPRYLEVNYAVCSAVYLRHPVCGPGFAEVPTPYGAETGALAFNWYLRRR